jgi:hypothetical protein
MVIRFGNDKTISINEGGIITLFGVEIQVLHAPRFCVSLLSVSYLNSLGWSTVFASQQCRILNQRGLLQICLHVVNCLYQFFYTALKVADA